MSLLCISQNKCFVRSFVRSFVDFMKERKKRNKSSNDQPVQTIIRLILMIFRRMFAFPEDVIDLLNDGKCDNYFCQLVQLKFRL